MPITDLKSTFFDFLSHPQKKGQDDTTIIKTIRL